MFDTSRGKFWAGTTTGDTIDMASILLGGRDKIEETPAVISLINVNSPLRYDDRMLGALFEYTDAGQPVIVTPFLMAGAMSPMGLAGTLAQQTAEALAGIALVQLLRPGTPCVYGSFLTNTDMQSGSPAFGTPESAMGILASAQMSVFDLNAAALSAGESIGALAETAATQSKELAQTAKTERDLLAASTLQSLGAVSEAARYERESLEADIDHSLQGIAGAAAREGAALHEGVRGRLVELAEVASAEGEALKADALQSLKTMTEAAETASQ